MIKLNINIPWLAIVIIVSSCVAKGQDLVKDFLTHKVIVNLENRTIVAYVKPVKSVSLDSDKYYYWFSPNQISSTQGGFSGKLLNGDYQEFYTNKQLKESGYLNKGLKIGVWKSWKENGKLETDYTWDSGRMNGVYHKYDSVGKVQETGRYKNDLLHGKQKSYTIEGIIEQLYKNGIVIERKKIPMPKFLRDFFNKKPKSM